MYNMKFEQKIHKCREGECMFCGLSVADKGRVGEVCYEV